MVVSTPTVNKIYEPFTHNPLTWAQNNPTFLSIIIINKECIANARKSESDFGGGHHGCTCVAMVDQKYNFHSHIAFIPPRKPGRSLMYPLNPMHGDISVLEQQYQNKLHDYRLFRNIHSTLKKIVVAYINNQWIKGGKDMVMGHTNKSFVKLMHWLYVRYIKMTHVDLMRNQNKMRATYNVKYPMEILFDKMDIGQQSHNDILPIFPSTQ